MTGTVIISMADRRASIALAEFEAARQTLLRAWRAACAAGQVSPQVAMEETAGTALAMQQIAALAGGRE